MYAVLTAALPVFALIFTGWIAGRRALLDHAAMEALNRYVIYLALPALLFLATSRIDWSTLAHGGYALSMAGGMAAAFLVALPGLRRGAARLSDFSIEALSNSYANVGFMGIPLTLAIFGKEGLPPTIIAILLTACVLFGISVALIEFDLQQDRDPLRIAAKVLVAVIRNPLLLSPMVGLAWSASGIAVPQSLEEYVTLLGDSASPCALVAIGLFLAHTPSGGKSAAVTRVVVAKLVVQPAVAALLAFYVFPMPRLWACSAVLMSALPIGTGPFMLAQMYGRDAQVASRAILLSTVGSVLTISALVAWIGGQGLH
jgi:predicted permease